MTESQDDKIRMLPGKTRDQIAASPLPFPDRDTLDAQEQALFDEIMEREVRFFNSFPTERGGEFKLTPLFQGLLQSPRLAKLWAGFGDFYQTSEERGSFNNRERDVALMSLLPTLTIARTGKFPLSPVWVTWAVSTGVTPKDIKAILEERVDDLAPEDRQLFEFVRATASGALTSEQFRALADRWDVKTAIEFISMITWRIGLLRTVNAHWLIQDLIPDSAAGWAVLQEYLDGTRKVEAYDMASSWVTKDPAAEGSGSDE